MSYLIYLTLVLFISYIHSCQWSATKCGCARVPPSTSHRIVGGKPAIAHSWPWIVGIRESDYPICGGVLINERYVLSAAHCFPSNYHSGMINRYSFAMGHNFVDDNHFVAKAKRIILHTSYGTLGTKLNDIALIELDRKVNFENTRVGFICLPKANINGGEAYPPIGTPTWVVGWGTTKFLGSSSPILLQVSVPITNNAGCKQKVTSASKQICAGYDEGGKDSCQGDSGGPLVVDTGNGVYQLVGIVSFGEGCGGYMKPGIYTRVSGYIDWINDSMGGSLSSVSSKPILTSKGTLTSKPSITNNNEIIPQALLSTGDYRQLSCTLFILLEILVLV